MISAKMVEDSLSGGGVRLATLQLRYPRFIHAEFMTHRVFSRNASSSRAVPTTKLLRQVREEPAMPIHWGRNQPGMQAEQQLMGPDLTAAQELWGYAAAAAADTAEVMLELGAHKQVVNRILEPFTFINVIVTATEWDNFFELRDHKDAQPEIRELARAIRKAMQASKPVERPRDRQHESAWHLPYVLLEERTRWAYDPHQLAKLSAARCARVSYLNHDGTNPDTNKDIALYEKLAGSRPRHASPVEHQAYPLPTAEGRSRNFRGWRQFREIIEG